MVFHTNTIKNGEDSLNKNHERTFSNSDKFFYNCAGYALGTFSWYCPYSEETRFTMPLFEEEAKKKAMKISVKQMLSDFPNLRLIDKIEDLREDEYAIAYRMGSWDFHYAKRGHNGIWYHKRGRSERIVKMTKRDVFSEAWDFGDICYYDSELILMAMRED